MIDPDPDQSERDRLEQLFAIADTAIEAGFDVLPAAVTRGSDGRLNKAPLLIHGHLDAHRQPQQIRQQLVSPPVRLPEGAEMVVGFVPGSGGCGVLDCDIKDGKPGFDTLARLVDTHGPFVGSAWHSPSGGTNILFRKPRGARYGNRSPWPGIDVRADNGWVVAPGSACSGGRWTWIQTSSYTSPLELPAAMLDQLAPATAHATGAATNAETVAFIEASPKTTSLNVQHAFAARLEQFAETAKGGRHQALLETVSWAFGMEHLDLRRALDDIRHRWARLTAGEGRADEVDEIATWVAGQEIPKRRQTPPTDSDGDMVPLDDWGDNETEIEDLLEGVIIPGRWSQVVAQKKEGKTSLLMYLAIELSEGRHPFKGTPGDHVETLYLDGEMGKTDVGVLIEDLGHQPSELTARHFHTATTPLRLDTEADAGRLLRRVDQLGARLVVLDGLNGFLVPGVDENDAKAWLPFFAHTIAPLKARGVAIMSGDNLGKDPARGARGSSVKGDKADAIISVKQMDNGLRLKTLAARGGAYIDQLDLAAEGFDRSRPIRYWVTTEAWPAGTSELVALLDQLAVPLDLGRRQVRALLRVQAPDGGARNQVLDAAIRYRRQHLIRPGSTPGSTFSDPPGVHPPGPDLFDPSDQRGP